MGKRVLVVDDSAMVREYHAAALRESGFQVEWAANGYEAMEKAISGQYDLLIVDVNMPKMDGYELVRTLRENDGTRSLPVIMVTTEKSEADCLEGFRCGANVFLTKPVENTYLAQIARVVLGVTEGGRPAGNSTGTY